MNVVEILTDQHRQVDRLFDRYGQAADAEAKGRIAREVVTLLSKHSGVEEMDVYPVIKHEVSEPAADSLVHEHQELKELLADIESMDPGDAGFDAKVAAARASFKEHIAEEEGQVFPRLEQELDRSTLDDLGQKIQSKWDGAPTHPHPNQPPANKASGPVVGLVDKARDALGGS